MPAWSYSALKTFETCPRKYQAEKITKEVTFTDTEHTIYGKELHKAAEDFINDGTPIPDRFSFIRGAMENLNNPEIFPGERFCEMKLGVKKKDGRLEACDYFDPEVWFRGIADLVIIDDTRAWVVDYKTSKNTRYADPRQLALMAAALFLKYPKLEQIKGMLLFVVCNGSVKEKYAVDFGLNIFAELNGLLTAMQEAYASDVWNPRPNGLCRNWCGVKSCPHSGD